MLPIPSQDCPNVAGTTEFPSQYETDYVQIDCFNVVDAANYKYCFTRVLN
jgi:hypothetical protein